MCFQLTTFETTIEGAADAGSNPSTGSTVVILVCYGIVSISI